MIDAMEQPRVRVKVSDRADPWIVGIVLVLVLTGIIFVFGTSYFFASYAFDSGYMMTLKHLVSIMIGGVLMYACSRFRSDWLERHATWLLVGAVLLLLLTLVPGVGIRVKGASRWIPAGFFNFQPAELVKMTFVIWVSAHLAGCREKVATFRHGMVPTLTLMTALGGILLMQPDFGTAALIGVLGLSLMFLAGVRLHHVLALGVMLGAAAAALVIVEPYRFKRLVIFLNPDADPLGVGWQLRQALIAFGSGQLSGVGLGASTQKSGWLPEAHTDFIFSVIGEETGLLGATVVLLLFAFLSYRGFRVAHRHPDPFGQLLAAGITLLLTAQATINMGVVLGLLPTKGIGLPYISYGGSSMMMFLAATGVLMSLSRELRER